VELKKGVEWREFRELEIDSWLLARADKKPEDTEWKRVFPRVKQEKKRCTDESSS